MPLTEILEIDPFAKVGLWDPAETIGGMLASLGTHRQIYLDQLTEITSLKRRREFLCSRLLLDGLTDGKKEIVYNEQGAPFLADGSAYISVSHTAGCVAVGLAVKGKIGVDVELIAPKAFKVRERFLSRRELELCEENDPLRMSVLLWSAKESLFKIAGVQEVDFREHFQIDDFIPAAGKGELTAKESCTARHNLYRIYYRFYPAFVLTVCRPVPEDVLA